MTARTPHSPGGGDVSETLGELERKLRQLETELASTGSRPSVTPAPEPETPAASAAIPAATSTIDEPAPTGAARAATGMGDPDRLIAEARARLGGLSGQVDELLRFRESLQRTARELEDEYSRVLARIGAPAQTAAPAPAPAAATTALRGPIAPAEPPVGLQDHPAFAAAPAPAAPFAAAAGAPVAAYASPSGPPPGAAPATVPGAYPVYPYAQGVPGPPAPSAQPAQPVPAAQPPLAQPPAPPFAPAPFADPAPVATAGPPQPASPPPGAPSPYDDIAFEGTIVLDAGPFTDISALSTFEQGLARVPGAEDVYVSGFEGNRALVELRLVAPVALVREMRGVLPGGFAVAEAGSGRLRIDVHPILDPTLRS